MDKATEQLIANRGYSQYARTGDKSCYMYHNDNGICLEYYPEKDEFKLSFIHGMLTTSTGICGGFKNDKHFIRFEKEITRAKFMLR